ncbi:MAG TPA: hypothetical protein VJ782_02760 [Aeromicrobium sp.]|nr:hypothetical protein [Aeromicrobium sp.]
MADCAVVGCSQPALDVWRPGQDGDARFHYLVCEFHGLTLRSGADFTAKGADVHVESLPRLLDWNVTQSGGHAVMRLIYGDELNTVTAEFEADLATLKDLGRHIAGM